MYKIFLRNILVCCFLFILTCERMRSCEPMKQLCIFVPMMTGVEQQNGPIVPLDIAKQSQVFADMLDNTLPEEEIIRFHLPDCNEKTACLFADCLTALKTTEEEEQQKDQDSLTLQIKKYSQQQKISLCNIAEYAIVPLLADKLYAALVTDSIDQELLTLLNPDVRKKYASRFIAQQQCDVTLLKAYAEKLRTQEYVLERQGWLLRPFVAERQLCYFDKNTNTIAGVIKKGSYIASLYISKLHPLQRWSTTLAIIAKKMCNSCDEIVIDFPEDLFLDKVISFNMNNKETHFLCTFADNIRNEKIFFVEIATKTVTQTNNMAVDTITGYIPSFLNSQSDVFFVSKHRHSNNEYILHNNITKNEWSFDRKIVCESEVLLYNTQHIIRIEYEDYKRRLLKTSIINCVDDVMRSFAKNISANQLPLVVYTITKNPVGRVALNENEYIEYENIPEECRAMIDDLYVITKDNILSRNFGIVRKVYRAVLPYIKSIAIWAAWNIPLIMIPISLSVMIPRISSKEFSDMLHFMLKI